MTGLMRKDLLVLRKQLRTYLIFLVIYGALSVAGLFPLAAVAAMIQILMVMLPISAFSFDEIARWDRYAAALPGGRRAMVTSRYLFTFLVALAAAVLGAATCLILSRTTGEPVAEGLAAVLACLGLGLFIADVLLPLCYKWGVERARPWMYVVIFVPVLLFVGAWYLGLLDWLNAVPEEAVMALTAGAALLPFAGMLISWRISLAIMERKEL